MLKRISHWHFDLKLTQDLHKIYFRLTQKGSLWVELFRFKGIFDRVQNEGGGVKGVLNNVKEIQIRQKVLRIR